MVADNAPLRLADVIDTLLSDSKNSAESIRASVDRFGWSNIAEAIIPEYNALIGYR